MEPFVRANPSSQTQSQAQSRRKFPRREMKRSIGILCAGDYFVAQSGELGEGGMLVLAEYILQVGHKIVVSFHIPGGDFASLRAEVKSVHKKNSEGLVAHGIRFDQIQFAHKRQIRSFVSSREK
jgi:c-di-GMP-binding flagellar brake protein YcgR